MSKYQSPLRRLFTGSWYDVPVFLALNVWFVAQRAPRLAAQLGGESTLAWLATVLGAASLAAPLAAVALGHRAAATDEDRDWSLAALVATGMGLFVLRLLPGLALVWA